MSNKNKLKKKSSLHSDWMHSVLGLAESTVEVLPIPRL